MKLIANLIITPVSTSLNGNVVSDKGITDLYREYAGDYPKFFKMDSLCKLGFIGAEIMLNGFSYEEKENCAVILFNKSGSLITDRNYENTIADDRNYFPSPSLFVYTLANIVTGEISIRHKIYGETSFYVTDKYDESFMESIVRNTLLTSKPSMILYGWVEYQNDNNYLADLKLCLNKIR